MEINKETIKEMIRNYFGSEPIEHLSEMSDGYAKRTYRLDFKNQSFLLQIWNEPHHRLTRSELNLTDDIFRQGLENLFHAKKILDSLSIRTPRIIHSDASRRFVPYDFAIFEFIAGGNLFENPNKFNDDRFISELGEMFGRINSMQRAYPGFIVGNGKPYNVIDAMYKSNVENLEIGTRYNLLLKEKQYEIITELKKVAHAIRERKSYSLIHGDFKPNHFLFDNQGNLVLIDCDGMQYFDVEYEYAQFMVPQFAFSNCQTFFESYHKNREIEIDKDRLLFYKACHAISGISFCSEYLIKYNGKDPLYEKIIQSNEETIKKELIRSAL